MFGSEQDSSPIYWDSPKIIGLGEGAGQSIHGGGNKQDEWRGNIFGKIGDTESIIFCTKGFNSNRIFQIVCDYETENVHRS